MRKVSDNNKPVARAENKAHNFGWKRHSCWYLKINMEWDTKPFPCQIMHTHLISEVDNDFVSATPVNIAEFQRRPKHLIIL